MAMTRLVVWLMFTSASNLLLTDFLRFLLGGENLGSIAFSLASACIMVRVDVSPKGITVIILSGSITTSLDGICFRVLQECQN